MQIFCLCKCNAHVVDIIDYWRCMRRYHRLSAYSCYRNDCVVDDTQGRRGGGGGFRGGSRYSSTRYSSRSSSNVRYSSSTRVRVRTYGSGYYNRYYYGNWRGYGGAGYVYGYAYYVRSPRYVTYGKGKFVLNGRLADEINGAFFQTIRFCF